MHSLLKKAVLARMLPVRLLFSIKNDVPILLSPHGLRRPLGRHITHKRFATPEIPAPRMDRLNLSLIL